MFCLLTDSKARPPRKFVWQASSVEAGLVVAEREISTLLPRERDRESESDVRERGRRKTIGSEEEGRVDL